MAKYNLGNIKDTFGDIINMVTKKDIGKLVRLIEPGEKHAGKYFILETIDDRFKSSCKIIWTNKNARMAERIMIVQPWTITRVKKDNNFIAWLKSWGKIRIKWGTKGYWKWPDLKTGGK